MRLPSRLDSSDIPILGQPPAPAPDAEHLWCALVVVRVTDPAGDKVALDVNNIISADGPRCFVCELHYSVSEGTSCTGQRESD